MFRDEHERWLGGVSTRTLGLPDCILDACFDIPGDEENCRPMPNEQGSRFGEHVVFGEPITSDAVAVGDGVLQQRIVGIVLGVRERLTYRSVRIWW